MVRIVSHVLRDKDGAENEHCLTIQDFRTRDLGAVCDRRTLFETIQAGAQDPKSIYQFGFAQWDQSDDDLVIQALHWLEGEVTRRGWTKHTGPRVWYDISGPIIKKIGTDSSCGINLTGLYANKFESSTIKAAKFAYPDFDFILVAFMKAPTHSTRNDGQVRRLYTWYEEKMGWDKPEDWYQIKADDFRDTPWNGIFSIRFGASPLSLARFMYPGFEWEPWRFNAVPTQFWGSPREQKACLDSIIKHKELDGPKDLLDTENLFELSFEDLCKEVVSNSGIVIQSGFKHTFDLISLNYPEEDLYPWMQSRCSEFWGFEGNRRWYLDWLMEKLGLDSSNKENFSFLTTDIVRFNFGRGLIHEKKRIRDAIIESYPEHAPWDLTLFDRQTSGYFQMVKQPLLYRHLCNLCGESLVDYRYYHPEIVNHTGRKLELDVWISSHKLAFEYSPKWTHSDPKVKKRDKFKKKRCEELGITLITLDEKWDGSLDFVRSEILKERPELKL